MKLTSTLNDIDTYSQLVELVSTFKSNSKQKFNILVTLYCECDSTEDSDILDKIADAEISDLLSQDEYKELVQDAINEGKKFINSWLDKDCGKSLRTLNIELSNDSDFEALLVDESLNRVLIGFDLDIVTNEILPNELNQILESVSELAEIYVGPGYYELNVHVI